MIRNFLFFFLILSQGLLLGKSPDIRPGDVKKILTQIMEAHASHKELTPTLVKRSLELYLEELDPMKTYLFASEVERWLSPSSASLERFAAAVMKKDFSIFMQIHELMTKAIIRRNRLEKDLPTDLPKNVSVKEFKELGWADDEEALSERLLRIKALQTETAEKLDKSSTEKTLRRIEKNRLHREETLSSRDSQERERIMLSNVLKAITASFDTHTAYFTPGEATQFMIQLQQRLFGIGALLKDDLNGFTIVKIIEGGPASQDTGLKVNDQIIAIDGEPVVGMELFSAVELIRGEEGTPIQLTVLRDEVEKLEIDITRGEVVIKEARMESTILPFGDGVIAKIALHAFYQDSCCSSASDLHEEILKIQKEHKIKGIILDLRHNSGGVLPQAVAVTGLFITKGIVVSIKDNTGHIEHLRDIEGKTAYDGPLVVLTSKVSASAAEIVAQTLQDYGRALIVGDEHTFGKGTFQTFTLENSHSGKVNPKGEYKVTRGIYYTVSGKSPQLVGVVPNIVVPGPYSQLEIGEQYAKYPLENDSIEENYLDDLSDIPESEREQISWLYRYNLQPRLRTYTRHLDQLCKNSDTRLQNYTFYQNFLKDIAEEELNTTALELYHQSDLQLQETVNIMKDLILLLG